MIDVEKFKAARAASGLSQARLAEAAGVSQQLIGEIEKGRSLTTKAIYRLAEAMNVKAYDLDDAIPRPPVEWEETIGDLGTLSQDEQDYALKNLRDFIAISKNRAAKLK